MLLAFKLSFDVNILAFWATFSKKKLGEILFNCLVTLFPPKLRLNSSLTLTADRLLFQIISYDSPRGGVSVITEKGDVTASFLVVQHAKPSDSGTYSCSPSVGETVSVNVHVLRGESHLSSTFQGSVRVCEIRSFTECPHSLRNRGPML
jgi:hypothetical protein